MKLLAFLMENYEVDNMSPEDMETLWKKIEAKFGRDDYTEMANILVLINELPKELRQKFWDRI